MTLAEILVLAKAKLQPSESAHLDAELLLADTLQVSRAYLLAHGERLLTVTEADTYQALLQRRQQGEPLAYLRGHKEFWSLDLQVTPSVLIPRPETELLVELLLELFPEKNIYKRVADLGTGSGAVALALAVERPQWEIYASDQAAEALALAASNAAALGQSQLKFCQGNWCQALPLLSFDAIVSNPPYLSEEEWKTVAKELHFEPRNALLSGEDGLSALREIIPSAKNYLCPGGFLLLEHGAAQAAAVCELLLQAGYTEVSSHADLAGKERVSKGRRP